MHVRVRRPFSLDKRIVPGAPQMEPLAHQPEESDLDRFYPIDGDYLVIRYADVKTLNVQFIKLTE